MDLSFFSNMLKTERALSCFLEIWHVFQLQNEPMNLTLSEKLICPFNSYFLRDLNEISEQHFKAT